MKKNLKSSKNQPGKRKVKAGKASATSGVAVRGKSERQAAIASRKDSIQHTLKHQRPE